MRPRPAPLARRRARRRDLRDASPRCASRRSAWTRCHDPRLRRGVRGECSAPTTRPSCWPGSTRCPPGSSRRSTSTCGAQPALRPSHPPHAAHDRLASSERCSRWGAAALAAAGDGRRDAARADAFGDHVERFLAAAGGISGDARTRRAAPPARRARTAPLRDGPGQPRRDARFDDPFNTTAQIDEYYYDESKPDRRAHVGARCKRLREMDVPEWMAPILFKTRGKPWDYYRDIARQLWDEARHAMMGEIALCRARHAVLPYPIDLSASVSLNTRVHAARGPHRSCGTSSRV